MTTRIVRSIIKNHKVPNEVLDILNINLTLIINYISENKELVDIPVLIRYHINIVLSESTSTTRT